MRTTFTKTAEADRKLSHLHAKKIAAALASKAVRETKTVVGEPKCDYKVPCHIPEFWCRAKVSETTIIFQSNHRRGAPTSFCFTLTPWATMSSTIEVPGKHIIGHRVYRPPYFEEARIVECLSDERLRAELCAILREGVTFLFCSASQLLAEFESRDPAVSARRIRTFQSLQLALYRFSQR